VALNCVERVAGPGLVATRKGAGGRIHVSLLLCQVALRSGIEASRCGSTLHETLDSNNTPERLVLACLSLLARVLGARVPVVTVCVTSTKAPLWVDARAA
jgi:hypothetical protein